MSYPLRRLKTQLLLDQQSIAETQEQKINKALEIFLTDLRDINLQIDNAQTTADLAQGLFSIQ